MSKTILVVGRGKVARRGYLEEGCEFRSLDEIIYTCDIRSEAQPHFLCDFMKLRGDIKFDEIHLEPSTLKFMDDEFIAKSASLLKSGGQLYFEAVVGMPAGWVYEEDAQYEWGINGGVAPYTFDKPEYTERFKALYFNGLLHLLQDNGIKYVEKITSSGIYSVESASMKDRQFYHCVKI